MREARRRSWLNVLGGALVALGLAVATVAQALTQDLTGQFAITRSGLVLNRTSNTFDSTITLRNSSGAAILAPIDVVVGGLPSGPNGVTLANKVADQPDGRPYVSPMAVGSLLQPGGTLTFVLKFANPARVTFTTTLQILRTVVEAPPSAPSLLGVVATGGTNAHVIGRVDGAANRDIGLQVASANTCIAGTLVNGAGVGGPVTTRTDAAGYFQLDVAGVNPGTFVALSNAAAGSPFSLCLVSSRDNDSWPKAFLLEGSAPTARDLIDAPGKARWYKFAVTPGQRIDLKLSGLPADYDLAVFKDIAQAFASQFNPATAGASDLLRLTAEYAPSTFSPSTFSPSTFSPSTFSPDAYSPSTFSPSTFSPSVFSPSTFSPSTFSPSTFSPSTFSPSTFSPSTFSPSTFSPSTFSPSIYTLTEIQQAFSTAQTRSIVAISATAGLSDEATVVNTWNRTGYFYARVTGRSGAFDTSIPFTLNVTMGVATCEGVTDTVLTPRPAVAASGLKTVLITDSSKTALDAALPGPAGGTLRSRLAAFAARSEVSGVVVDVAGDGRISALRQQAANNPACPFAKNLVAEALKGIVDSYRANPLQYVVLVGNDDAIPFFRSPDESAIGQESGYVPPVQSNSPSEASLRRDFVLSQDRYGSKTSISLPWNEFPVPGLAVGRLVETPSEIAGLIDAYVAAGSVVSPHTSLVTGYDFLEDAATAVKSELDAGTGAAGDALITPNGTSPQASSSWTATQLRAKLFGSRHDVIFLAGHFSANSALAADFATSVLTTDLAASTTNFTNSIIFSAGCHAGYNLVDGDAIPGVTLPLDWAQAFARKQATLIAGTGYQYGDTDFLEYSERLYNNFARQLRAGPPGTTIAVGEALVQAKLAYLAATPDIRGLHEKALLEATLFGLPMLAVNMPAGRGAVPGTSGVINPASVAAGPAATLGLQTYDLGVAPNLIVRTQTLTNLQGGPGIIATWLSGPDGVVTKPGEPALPLAVVNVTPTVPSLVLRGIGYRGGTYVDSGPLVPFTGAATTESRGVHVPFLSPVFYPSTLWTPNYYGALAGNGGTQLLVSPVQYRAASVADGTSTQRRHTGMNLRLFYSGNLSQAALSDAPSIVAVDAQQDATGITFSAQVVGDPAAAIYQVWVTYTGDGIGTWTSLDLSQCVAPLPAVCGASEDSRLWKGRLSSPPANIKYFVQAANGVGLVSRNDNVGAYFGIASITPAATVLTLVSPPSTAIVGDSPTVTARLTYAGGVALAGKMVAVGVGGASRFGVTGSDGNVTVRMPVAANPGDYLITAAFASDEVYQASSASAPLTINRAAVTPAVLPPSAGAASTGINITGALGNTNAGLQGVAVTFTVNVPGNPTPITVYSITDYLGNAIFPPPSGLPPGDYTVTQASFGGNGTYAPTTITFPAGTQVSVPKLDQSINFPAPADRSFGVPDFDPGAQASSLLPVSYGASGACTVAGSTVHLTGTGNCTITADQAGNATYNAAASVTRTFSIGAQATPPTVLPPVRAAPTPTMADTVTYTLTFSEAVTGVASGNFAVVTSGITEASVAGVSGTGASWAVTVNTGHGTGTLHLDLVNGAGITNTAGAPLAGTPVTGETYQIDKGGTVVGSGEGQLVPGFGTGGYALFSDVPRVVPPSAIAVLADGRILAAGGIGCAGLVPSDPASPAYCMLQLARYSTGGTPDASFGTNGRLVTAVSNVNPELSALIVNGDGSFFVTGSRHNGLAEVPFAAKFTNAGAPVTAFGGTGLATLDSLPMGFGVSGAAIDASGRIVISSTTPDVGPERNDIFVTRLTGTGVIDASFGIDGVAQFALSTVDTRSDRGTAVAVHPDGSIVVGGRTQATLGTGFDFLLLRLDANGLLDPSFGVGGIARTHFPSSGTNLGRKLVLQPDDKIVLVGNVDLGAINNQCGVARFNADGTLDANFGSGGRVVEAVAAGCSHVSLQVDGKLVIVANDVLVDVQYGTFLRLLATGAPDAGFGTGGFLDISNFGTPARVVFTAGGNLVTSLVIQDQADGLPKSYVVELSSGPVANQLPIANAGPDQTVTAGATVQLTSAGSIDPEGNSLSYSWTLTTKPAGSAAALNNSTFANPTFIADRKGTYVAQLIVNDGGVPPLDSAPDTVEITATNRTPTAVADSYGVAQGGTLVVNAATGVLANDNDADGDALTAALVANVTHGSLTLNLDGGFTYTPSAGYSGPDSFTYRANDGTDDSNTATVSLTVTGAPPVNHPPVANAGANFNMGLGAALQLGFIGTCTDIDGDSTTRAWSVVSRPAGSNAVPLPSGAPGSPGFVPDLPGLFELQLICNDGHVDSLPSVLAITVIAPTISLTLANSVTGIGQPVAGTITLSRGALASGVDVTLVSSDTGIATVAPSPVSIGPGGTTGVFTVTGVAPGTSTITGTAPNSSFSTIYTSGTVDIQVTSSAIVVGNVALAPGQALAFAVALTTPAPAGGVTVNLSSSDAGVVTVPASIFIAAGATFAATDPVATGVVPGTATITATATGYASGHGLATVAVSTVLTVTNTNDSGAGSLREAISEANLYLAPDPITIVFAPGVTGTITLTTGQIRIEHPLTIVGPGAGSLTIDGNLNGRIFTIIENNAPACPALSGPNDYQVSISGLTLKRGSRNVADSGGGAIQSAKSLGLDDVIIRDSQARGGGALVFNAQYPGQTLGISNSQFLDNVAKPVVAGDTNSHNGGAILVHDYCPDTRIPAVVAIDTSEFSGNRVQPVALEGRGGAIAVYDNSTLIISDTRIVDNHVEPPVPPVAGFAYPGGGIQTTTTSVTIYRSEIAGNSADYGGGLSVAADIPGLQAPGSAFAFLLLDSTVSGNVANQTSGGINVHANVHATIANSTLSGNSAPAARTGGIGISNGPTNPPSATNSTPPTLTLVSSIVANSQNSTADIGGLPSAFIPSPYTVNITKSLLGVAPGPNFLLTDTTTTVVGVDPLLGSLAQNGGLTRTHALLAGSPAIDAGSNPFELATDQRGIGFPRVFGPATDMGAYEAPFGANHAPVANAGTDQNAATGQLVHLSGSCADVDNDGTTPTWGFTSRPAGSNAALSSTSILNPTFTPDIAGAYGLQLVCNDTHVDSTPSSVTITAANPTLSLALPSSLVGVGASVNGTITLSAPAPAGGVNVTLVSSNTAFATVAPSPVTIAAGATTGSFTVTGVAPGSVTITGSASGYTGGSVDIGVTTNVISVGFVAMAPGQTQGFTVTLATPAPAGGVAINLASGDVSVVTVPASVFIPEGAIVPAVNPIATGVASGIATITGTSAGYVTGSAWASVAAPVQWTAASGGNDRWYQFIYSPAGFTWQQAWASASGNTYLGLPGYLATATSQAENDFLYALAKYPAGATGTLFDPANPNVSLGSTSIAGRDASTWLGGADAATEGTWRWVNGPETGNLFWTGDSTGSAPPGAFAWWDNPSTPGGAGGNEPNASSTGEDFLQLRYSGGRWNDSSSGVLQILPGTNPDGTRIRAPAAFLVEYSPATPPVTFTVTNTNDSGVGSLRDAIAQANLAPGPNTIAFAPAVTGTILLTSGQIAINGPLTIVGPGVNNLTIDGNANGRIFSIFATDPACPALDGPDYLVSISGLRLTNARRITSNAGGAIFSEHSLALDSVIVDSSTAGHGGGVSFQIQYPGQSLTIGNTQFLNNIAQPLSATPGNSVGAALSIFERCTGTLTTPVTVSVASSVFSGNRSQPVGVEGHGGAIFVSAYADVTITDTRIVDNRVVLPAQPVGNNNGGGLWARVKSLGIERSEISQNTADFGAGLRLNNDVPALQAPALAMPVKIVNSTISGNAAGGGPNQSAGAITVYGNVALELDNSTVSNNSAAGFVGGIVLSTGATDPVSAGNATAPTLTLASSILANNTGAGGDVGTATSVIPAFAISASNSLIETICSSCNISVSGSGNVLGVDPVLSPLAFNGGPTRTHALLAGSPAIDAGSNPLALATDQRGSVPPGAYPRVVGAAPDMGAYESAGLNNPPVASVGADQNALVGHTVNLTGSCTDPDANPTLTYHWTFSQKPAGSNATLINSTTAAPSFVPDQVGTYSAQLICNDGTADSAPAATNVTVAGGTFTLTLVNTQLVGVGLTAGVRVTLSNPAPTGGLVVTLSSDNTGVLGIVGGGTVTIPQAGMEGTGTVSGVAAGSTTLRASASGYVQGNLPVTVSNNVITVGGPTSIVLNATASVAITISQPAPAGGLNLTVSSSDPAVISVVTPSLTIPQGQTSVNATLRGNFPGNVTVTAQGTGYASGAAQASVGVTLDITVTSVTFRLAESSVITIALKSGGNPAVAPPGGLPLTLASSDSGCVIAPSVTVPAGQESTTTTLTYGGTAALPCTSTVTASGPAGTTSDTVAVTVTAVSLRFSSSTGDPIRVGAGLEECGSGMWVESYNPATGQIANVSTSTVVTIGSSNGAGVVVSPNDATTVGGASTTVTIGAGSYYAYFCVAGVAGQAGATSTLTVSAGGFGSGTRAVSVLQPVLGLVVDNLNPTTQSGDVRSYSYIGIGSPTTPTVLATLEPVRKGGGAVSVSFGSANPAVAQMVVNGVAGATATTSIAAGQYYTPTSGVGMVSVRPVGAGSAAITATASGFVQSTGGSYPNPRTVTVSGTSLRFSSSTGDPIRVGAGLEECGSGMWVESYNPATGQIANVSTSTVVTIGSSNGAGVVVSPNDATTVGGASTTVTIGAGSYYAYFCVAGVAGQAGATSTLTVSAGGFGSGTRAVSVLQPVLGLVVDNLNPTTQSGDVRSYSYIGIGSPTTPTVLATLEPVRKGGGAVSVSFGSANPAVAQMVVNGVAGATATTSIAAGQYYTPTSGVGMVSVRPVGAGSAAITATASGFVQSTGGSYPNPRTVTVSGTSLRFSSSTGDPIRVGAGLEECGSGMWVESYNPATGQIANVSTSTVVTIGSSNGAGVVVSPNDATTVGGASTTVTIGAGSYYAYFCVAGVAGQAGATSTLTVSAGGFGSGTRAVSVLQPVLGLVVDNLNPTTQSGDVRSYSYIGIGSPTTPTVLATLEPVRKGGGAVSVSFGSANPAVAQMVVNGVAGATATTSIAAGQYYTPTSGVGMVSVRPVGAGSAAITATASGFVQSTGGSYPNPRTVTVSGTSLRFSSSTGDPIRVGAGLEECGSGMWVESYNPATGQIANVSTSTVVTIGSSNGAGVVVSPNDATTVGGASTTVTIGAGSYYAYFCVAGVAGQAGATSTLTVSAGGFGSGTRAVSVLQPVLGLVVDNLNPTTQSGDVRSYSYIGIGSPTTPTVLATLEPVRKGGGAVSVSFGSANPAVAQMVVNGVAGATATTSIAAGQYYTPTSGVGMVSVRPVGAGSAAITATASGFVQSTGGSYPNPRTVTVSQ